MEKDLCIGGEKGGYVLPEDSVGHITELEPEPIITPRSTQIASGGLAVWLASPEGQSAKANR